MTSLARQYRAYKLGEGEFQAPKSRIYIDSLGAAWFTSRRYIDTKDLVGPHARQSFALHADALDTALAVAGSTGGAIEDRTSQPASEPINSYRAAARSQGSSSPGPSLVFVVPRTSSSAAWLDPWRAPYEIEHVRIIERPNGMFLVEHVRRGGNAETDALGPAPWPEAYEQAASFGLPVRLHSMPGDDTDEF
jgi:hypothetical protein